MKNRALISIGVLAALGLFGRLACADPPTAWVVTYGIHETPTQSSGPIVFLVKLSLRRQNMDGSSIGWHITSIQIIQKGPNGSSDAVWTQDNPSVSSPDGLWWIDHANAEEPQPSEFELSPHLTGTAAAADPNLPDLTYDVKGEPYAVPLPPTQPPYVVTGAMDWNFTRVGDQNPLDEGSGDPIDVDPPEGN
jgi:hypothetical protein